MPKNKKTRKQKMLADQRHQSDSGNFNTYSFQPQLPVKEGEKTKKNEEFKESVKTVSRNTITTNDYGYLSKDLLKTVVLTAAIIIGELLIRAFGNL